MTEQQNAYAVLERGWKFEGTPIYLSRSIKTIKKYLYEHGVSLSKTKIKEFLDNQKTSNIVYKNQGLRKLRETSKPFYKRPRFFSMLQADLLFLSKSRTYGTSKTCLLVVVDTLSRFTLIESCASKQFVSMQKAMEKIISRIKTVHSNFVGGELLTDSGLEFGSQLFKSFLRQHNIKHTVASRRTFRGSKGAAVVESINRRVRMHLEKVIVERKDLPFENKLRLIENQLNIEKLSCLGMSAHDALQTSPLEIMHVSNSRNIRKRKYLKAEIKTQNFKNINVGAIVRVKLNQDKEFAAVKKESYGSLSPFLVVLSVEKSGTVWTYKLANLLSLMEYDGSYTYNELITVNIPFFEAVRILELDVKKTIKIDDNVAYFSIKYFDMVLCANKSVQNV